MQNYMKLEIPSKTANEAFARAAVGAFAAQTDLNIEELSDIKTSVSEAVTNSIIHGYRDGMGAIFIDCRAVLIKEKYKEKYYKEKYIIEITVRDEGRGIENIDKAMEPLYTTAPDDERSGMGFTVMQSFMDSLDVTSEPGHGTTVKMTKQIGAEAND